jgi:hypothetical protein
MLNCQRRRRLGGLSPYEVENGAAPIGPLDMAGPLQHREVPVDLASMAKVMDQHKETVRFNKDPPLSGARPPTTRGDQAGTSHPWNNNNDALLSQTWVIAKATVLRVRTVPYVEPYTFG